jgi:streptomycin 6-kinase
MFSKYLARWGLTPDGDPIVTRNARLLPVRRYGLPAMLKIAVEAEEKLGARLMIWWEGRGAARVLAHDGDVLLLERAEGAASLFHLAHHGHDDEASRIICAVVAKLHAPRNSPPPELLPLAQWFSELEPAASRRGGIFATCAATAGHLLATQQEVVPLHGDIHHGNVLDFGDRGWLAIDPKGLIGERCFDYANIFCNPDDDTATAPGRFARQTEVVAHAAGLNPKRLVQWTLAFAGLSAAWLLADGIMPRTDLTLAELAAVELHRAAGSL